MKTTKNYAPALTIEEWRNTSIKKRIARAKDLKKYIAWCEENGQSQFQINFALNQLANISLSLEPINVKQESVESHLQLAVNIKEFGDINGFKNVKTWFWQKDSKYNIQDECD